MTFCPPRRVRRASSSVDSALSPFVLDPSNVIIHGAQSATQFDGTFLHTPVSIYLVRSRASALRKLRSMEQIRHPNLEQMLGVVISPNESQSMIISTKAEGRTMADLLQSVRTGHPLDQGETLSIALQAVRALHYLHKTTGRAHSSLCPHAVIHDEYHWKTVVLLNFRCRHCELSEDRSEANDVVILSRMLLDIVAAENALAQFPETSSFILLKILQKFASSRKTPGLTMSQLCNELMQLE